MKRRDGGKVKCGDEAIWEGGKEDRRTVRCRKRIIIYDFKTRNMDENLLNLKQPLWRRIRSGGITLFVIEY